MLLMVAMMLALFQAPTHAQGKERPVKYPTFYRTIQRGRADRRAYAIVVAWSSFLIPDVRAAILPAF